MVKNWICILLGLGLAGAVWADARKPNFVIIFTERAVQFIEANKDRPFFLYLPHPIPHRPVHMTAPYLEGVSDKVRKALAEEKATGTINYDVRDKLYFRSILSENPER